MADPAHPSWIALADGGPMAAMHAAIELGRLRIVHDPTAFCEMLRSSRPHIALVAVPPATHDVEDAALQVRRRRTGLRIVHLTLPGDVDRRLDALRRGFDDAITTEIDPDELSLRLEILDDRARERHATDVPVAHNVVLDPVAHEVRRDGELIHLRPKEFQLLAMLAANPGRAYSRRQLLDRVWGPGHGGDPRTVDVHVRWLRAKIEQVPAAPVHIVTVRGVGYRLDPVGR
jgi:DNA-binding response OmpR family regulator